MHKAKVRIDDHSRSTIMNHLQAKYRDHGRCGIANRGSYCYMNTAIQCLSHCLSFLDHVLEYQNPTGLFKELQEVLKILWQEDHGVGPLKFIHALSKEMGGLINVHQQNDIHEFIGLFAEKLCQNVGKTVPIPDNVVDGKDDNALSKNERFGHRSTYEWMQGHNSCMSDLCHMMYGQVVNQIRCTECAHYYHRFDVVCSLLVAFKNPASQVPEDLMEMIKDYMADETITARDCDACNSRADGSITHVLMRLPDVLTVGIKRYSNGTRQDKAVNVPDEIDLGGLTIHIPNITHHTSTRYRLKAIACHMGSMGSGHYVAICKHPDGSWYEYDDMRVSKIVNFDDKYKHSASSSYYMVFYEKEEPRRPRVSRGPDTPSPKN